MHRSCAKTAFSSTPRHETRADGAVTFDLHASLAAIPLAVPGRVGVFGQGLSATITALTALAVKRRFARTGRTGLPDRQRDASAAIGK